MQKNNKFIFICFGVVIVLVFCLPSLYNCIEKLKMPKIIDKEEKNKDEKKEVTQEILDSIHTPKFRSSIYESNTYYLNNTFTVSDMTNNDILYNAFLGIEGVNIKSYSGRVSCTTTPKIISDVYLTLRIQNILGKDIKYTLDSFYVPEDSSIYPGTWTYNSSLKSFIYEGLCTSKNKNVAYYDLSQFIKAQYENDDIIIYNYVGFAKVEGNTYKIYKDASYTQELTNGTFISEDNLNDVFASLNKKDKKIYKYTYKDTLCKYNEYCLYKGEYVNEF